MKRKGRRTRFVGSFVIAALMTVIAGGALAQIQGPALSEQQMSLAATINVDVFLTEGQEAQQATAEQIENFKKAFSVCLEAKKYMVKQ